jgi:hypothetical protein
MGTLCISQAVTQILVAFNMRVHCVILVILNSGRVDQLQSLSYVRPYVDFSMYPINYFTDFVVIQDCTLLCCGNIRVFGYLYCLKMFVIIVYMI